MERFPFGVPRLDSVVGGGAPAGSVVLLAGDAGAGAREFLYTAAAMNGLGLADEALFDLHYGELDETATRPASIHYVSLTRGADQLRDEMGFVLDDDIVDAGLEPVTFADLSPEYFQVSPVPREWYAEAAPDIESLGDARDRPSAFSALADYLDANADDGLVLVDSVTDLASLVRQDDREFSWADLTMLLQGLEKASHDWEGLVLLNLDKGTVSAQQLSLLRDAVDGTMLFEWDTGGSERARTLVVQQFRGVLSELEAEDIVRFETVIDDAGFDVSDVRKIR